MLSLISFISNKISTYVRRSFEENLKKITPKSEEVENLHQQVQKIVIVSFIVSLNVFDRSVNCQFVLLSPLLQSVNSFIAANNLDSNQEINISLLIKLHFHPKHQKLHSSIAQGFL